MESFSLVAVAIYCVVSLCAAIRLLLLAKRTREMPELMIGCALLSGGMIGYPFSVGAGVLAATSRIEAADLANAIGQTGMALAAFFLLLSWRHIFSPEGKAGLFFVVGWSVFLLATLVGIIRVSEPGSSAHFTTSTFWALMVAQGGCYALLGWASFRHASMLKKRCAIGLADPRIANRLFVWGLANASIVVSYLYAMVVGMMIGAGLPNIYHPSVVVGLGLISIFCVALSFFPPRVYLDWIGLEATPEKM